MNSAYTYFSQYLRIKELAAEQYLLGIGNTITPWTVEGNPPLVDPTENQVEVAAYLPITLIEPVIPVIVENSNSIRVEEKLYDIVDKNSIEEISSAGAKLLYFNTVIKHQELRSYCTEYRSLGLYRAVELEENEDWGNKVIEPEKVVQATLFYKVNLRLVTLQRFVEENCQLIIEVPYV